MPRRGVVKRGFGGVDWREAKPGWPLCVVIDESFCTWITVLLGAVLVSTSIRDSSVIVVAVCLILVHPDYPAYRALAPLRSPLLSDSGVRPLVILRSRRVRAGHRAHVRRRGLGLLPRLPRRDTQTGGLRAQEPALPALPQPQPLVRPRRGGLDGGGGEREQSGWFC